MSSIRLLSDETNIAAINMTELDWDLNVKGENYKCFRIPGYIHTIGGRYHENDLWACPRNEEPTVKNLIQFNGEAPRYSILIEENNYIKTKWDESEIRECVSCHILRNDKPFYQFVCRDVAYAYAKAYQLIESVIKEGVINFSKYRYPEKEIIGRHIWWKGEPYTLCSYIEGQCCAMAIPGHITEAHDVYPRFNGVEVKLDLLLDKHIGWFCKDY